MYFIAYEIVNSENALVLILNIQFISGKRYCLDEMIVDG
jgi:hypothetical protein